MGHIAPIKCIIRKRKAKGQKERETRSSLLLSDLKDSKSGDSGKQEEGKTFHKLHFLEMNDAFCDPVRGLGSETWIKLVS